MPYFFYVATPLDILELVYYLSSIYSNKSISNSQSNTLVSQSNTTVFLSINLELQYNLSLRYHQFKYSPEQYKRYPVFLFATMFSLQHKQIPRTQ